MQIRIGSRRPRAEQLTRPRDRGGIGFANRLALLAIGGRPRQPIGVIVAFASAGWLLGRLAVSEDQLPTGHSVPAVVVHLAYLALVALMVIALPRFRPLARSGPGSDRVAIGLDAMAVAVAILAIGWTTLVNPTRGDGAVPGMTTWAIAHVIANSTLLVAVVGVAPRLNQRGVPSTVRLFAVGLFGFVVADMMLLGSWGASHGPMGDVANVLALISCGAIAGANRVERRGSVSSARIEVVAPEADPMRGLSLPVGLGGAALGWLIWVTVNRNPGDHSGVVTYGALTVVGLALIRLTRTLLDARGIIAGLREQVDRDPLTGLINHRAVHERIAAEMATGLRDGHPVAVALIDVDNFKEVNDTYGHPVGDRVLRGIARVLTAACRATDVSARYAGDEFMLVLPGLDTGAARAVCQRILDEVARAQGDLAPGGRAPIGLSIGVAVSARCQRPIDQVVAIADAAMYDAKQGGKHRVVAVDADTLLSYPDPDPHPHLARDLAVRGQEPLAPDALGPILEPLFVD